MLAALIAPSFILIGLTGVIALLVVVNVGPSACSKQRPREMGAAVPSLKCIGWT
jgi:hypothetical protein